MRIPSGDTRARFAVDLFVYRITREIGAMAATLGGLDALVFTGGIGEHAAAVRAEICGLLAHLGVTLDPARNAAASPIVSVDGSPCTVRVVPADEERTIARHTARLLGSTNDPSHRTARIP